MDKRLPNRVLVAPLDWGLGHASRCIPIIRELQKRNAEVFIASSGRALTLLREEFPELTLFTLTPYNVHYSKRLSFPVTLFLQLPKFLNTIRKEHDEIERIIEEYKIDLIVSDNRFGCWSVNIPSVFITHQINLQMPRWLKWTEPLVSKVNQNWIKKFNYCWVPDELETPITGKLSLSKGINSRFVGMLSRFRKNAGVNKKYDLLVLLSGPEPQRTVLEKKLLKELKVFEGTYFFVRGLPGETSLPCNGGIDQSIANHLSSVELNKVVEESEIVISRSGYSSVMDLSRLAKKAIFIPTPGQTEQEYLASELKKRKIALCMDQDRFDLMQALELSMAYTGFPQPDGNNLLEKALDQLGV